MDQMCVIGEDAISCKLGERLVQDIAGRTLALPALNTGGITKLVKALPRYATLATQFPALCVADTDGQCVLEMLEHRPSHAPERFLLRFAVMEAESWLLADSEALAAYLGIAVSHVPVDPDSAVDAKRALLQLLRRSRNRAIRHEAVSRKEPIRPEAGYNTHMCHFVEHHWRPREAARRSPSLGRAVRRLDELVRAFD